jgi:hypothetical protein
MRTFNGFQKDFLSNNEEVIFLDRLYVWRGLVSFFKSL